MAQSVRHCTDSFDRLEESSVGVSNVKIRRKLELGSGLGSKINVFRGSKTKGA